MGSEVGGSGFGVCFSRTRVLTGEWLSRFDVALADAIPNQLRTVSENRGSDEHSACLTLALAEWVRREADRLHRRLP